MADLSIDPPADPSEIAALSRQLQAIDLQLRALTAGEVDAVIGPGGQSYLLHQAQTQLLRSDQEVRALAKQLQIEHSQLATAQAVAKIGSWSFDVVNDTIEWSDEMHRIWQTDPHEFVPACVHILELIHPQDRDAVDAAFIQSLKRGTSVVLEYRLVLPANITRYVEARWQLQRDEQGKALRVTGTCQDISERRQSEEALRLSQTHLSIASRLGRIGAWTLDLSQPHVVWSSEVCAIHEVPVGTSPSLAQAIQYYAPEYVEIISGALRSCVEQGTAFDVQLELVTARGRRVWVRSMGEAVRDAAGAVRMIQGAFQDLSDRKREEQETRRLATRLTTTLESLTIGFYTTDRDWRFTYVNAEAEKKLRRRREDLLGARLWDAIPEFIGTEFESCFRNAVAQNHTNTIDSQLGADGPWLRAIAFPSEEGLAVHLRDVTAERVERQQLKLLETSVARLNDMLVIVKFASEPGAEPLVQFVNDAFVRFTGYSREEIIGKSRRAMSGPDTDNAEVERIRAALAHFQPVRAELLNYKKNGEPYWVELEIAPVSAFGSTFTHFVGIERDITERKRHDEALRQLNLELEDRVRVRTAELTIAREEAEQAARTKSIFLATMSHEIRTPMNGVLGLIEVLAQTSLQTSQAEMVHLIRDSADSLLNLIDDILDFSKIEAGQLRIESVPMRLADVVQRVCGLLQTVAGARNVELTVYVAPDIPEVVSGDEHRLSQILMNLVGNAIKFSSAPDRPGRVSVRVELRDQRTDFVSIDLTVTDNGVGIDQAALSQLFTPFFQADASTTRRFGGTGLGLAITEMLVRLMGGEITVQSSLAQGATFRVRLPFQSRQCGGALVGSDIPAPAADRVRASAKSNLSQSILDQSAATGAAATVPVQSRVLIAEDTETNREVIRRQLQLLGYTAEMTVDGREALQRWRGATFDLVLTDLRMPELDGYGLAAAIRAEELPGHRTVIIALTANALPEEAARCRASGMDDYLVKPVRLPKLQATLEKWLAPNVRPVTSGQTQPARGPVEAPVDLTVLVELIGDDPADTRAVLEKFSSMSGRIRIELGEALASGSAPAARELAHKLKSSALSIGARRLGDLCAEIERVAASGRGEQLPGLDAQFQLRLGAVQAYLDSL